MIISTLIGQHPLFTSTSGARRLPAKGSIRLRFTPELFGKCKIFGIAVQTVQLHKISLWGQMSILGELSPLVGVLYQLRGNTTTFLVFFIQIKSREFIVIRL